MGDGGGPGDEVSDDPEEEEVPPASEWTIEDVWLTGSDEERGEIEDLAQRLHDEIVESVDQAQVERVRTGGHQVRVFDRSGIRQIQVSIYSAGPMYGFWGVSHSPEGHEVRIEHCLPIAYRPDGSFDVLDAPLQGWTVPAMEWRKNPERLLEDLMGEVVARQVAPLLHLPEPPPHAT